MPPKETKSVKREWVRFRADLQRFRPLVMVSLAVGVSLPSFDAMLTQGLSPIVTLVHFTEAIFTMNILTWCAAKLLTRYAKIQAGEEVKARQQVLAYSAEDEE
ncbi:MAG: hypothetical protein M0Z96_03425 [Actinomycetota bacterium]|nr:hypothetical protein [Actinomycetota bacterium]